MGNFLRLVLMEVVFLRLRKLLKMFASVCLLSSFLIVRIFVLVILLFFLCLPSFGAVLRFRVSRRSDPS